MRFTVVPSGPRLWPRIVWRLVAPGLRIAYDGGSVNLRWFRPNGVQIPDGISKVTISYLAFSWGDGSEATFAPRPGVTVRYRASAWPWVAGKLSEEAWVAGELSEGAEGSSYRVVPDWRVPLAIWFFAGVMGAALVGGGAGVVIAALVVFIGVALSIALIRGSRSR